ncbi:MAG: ABC transporter permease [Bacteroidaceae bacterium]
MIDLIREMSETLGRNKMRTCMTGSAVSVGIFLLIVLLGATNGVIHAFEKMSGDMDMDAIYVYGNFTTLPYAGLKEGRFISLDNRDRATVANDLKKNVTTSGAAISRTTTIKNGNNDTEIRLNGVTSARFDIKKIKIQSGRVLNDVDLRDRTKVIVVSNKCASRLFPEEKNVVGKVVTIDSTCYRVVGVYQDEYNDRSIHTYIPLSTMQLVYRRGPFFDNLEIKTKGIDSKEASQKFNSDIIRTLSKNHQYAPNDAGALWVYSTREGAEQTSIAMNALRTSMWVVGLLTLLGGVVGISNIMLITVKERTREFGIRKALGARSSSILKSVMLESVVITSFFGYIGLVLGVFTTEYLDHVAGTKKVDVGVFEAVIFLDPTVDMSVAIGALITLIIAGLFAGFFPARKAVKCRVVEALKS